MGLAAILVYWVAGLIGQAFRRKRGGVRANGAPVLTEGGSGPASTRRLRRGEGGPAA
jgi:hypothetical protein